MYIESIKQKQSHCETILFENLFKINTHKSKIIITYTIFTTSKKGLYLSNILGNNKSDLRLNIKIEECKNLSLID